MLRYLLAIFVDLLILSCNSETNKEQYIYPFNYVKFDKLFELCRIKLPKSYFEFRFISNITLEYKLSDPVEGNIHVYHDTVSNSFINIYSYFPSDTLELDRDYYYNKIRYLCKTDHDPLIVEYPSILTYLESENYVLFRSIKTKKYPLVYSVETISYNPTDNVYNYFQECKYIKYSKDTDGLMKNIGYTVEIKINSESIEYLKENFYNKDIIIQN